MKITELESFLHWGEIASLYTVRFKCLFLLPGLHSKNSLHVIHYSRVNHQVIFLLPSHIVRVHRCEPVPPLLEVRELELIFAVSMLLTTDVITNKRFGPRVWLSSIIEVDLLDLG